MTERQTPAEGRGQTSRVARSDFRRGALTGALVTLAIGGLVVVAALAAFVIRSSDEPPDPTATRHEVIGTVTQIGLRVCVEERRDRAEDAVPARWCGVAEGSAADVSMGDDVEGSIIGVELDPGSGAAWSFWESLEPSRP